MQRKQGGRDPRYESGFTLLELLVVITLAGIVATYALPNMMDVVRTSRMKAASTSMQAELMMARSEAATRNLPVVLCATTDDASCNGTSWMSRHLMFVDTDGSGTPDAGEPVVRVFSAPNSLASATASGSLVPGGITARPIGIYSGGAGSLIYCDVRTGATGRQISVTAGGVVTVAAASC